jgi:hypothetical protein
LALSKGHRMNIHQMATRVASRYLTAKRRKLALKKTQLLALMSRGNKFGVLSAYTNASKSENKRRHTQLIRDLQGLGYRRWETLRGKWEGVAERSILVPDMQPQHLFQLGREYDQDAVIYKSNKGVIGMYYHKGAPHAYVAADPKGTPLWGMSEDPTSELYSKARGLRFEFDFVWVEMPWDGRNPISKGDIVEFFESR